MAANRWLLDTNVLIAVVDADRSGHTAAVKLFDDGRPLALTPQILREFMVVASRPLEVNGLGLEPGQAAANAAAFASNAVTLEEDPRVALRLRQLVNQYRITGKQIHDANLVATALVHDVHRLVTANPRHFERFGALIEVIPLKDSQGGASLAVDANATLNLHINDPKG